MNESFKNRIGERISELEDKTFGMTQTEINKEKGIKKNEESPYNIGDIVKWTNIHIIGIPEGEEKENVTTMCWMKK